MGEKEIVNVGIGFATGRKSFQKILRTSIFNWDDSGIVEDQKVNLNLFIAYDLDYNKTKVSDYTDVAPELIKKIDTIEFIGDKMIKEEIAVLVKNEIITLEEATILFRKGYSANRNIVMYKAIKNQMDYLIFLDDDEYPMAVTKEDSSLIWGGQHILLEHLKYIKQADITHGHHCGYISPIPYIDFSENLKEEDFAIFISAISNDIINWDTLKGIMSNGGVTYANPQILSSQKAVEVLETNGAKFISGANLCFNLNDPSRLFPFYNPPGARGEDTFLSTCLSDRKVLRIPGYTFHDGFSTYNHLLEGVLPRKLKFIRHDMKHVQTRFYKACIGWIRYKPLLLYITDPDNYEKNISSIRKKLEYTLPKISSYFKDEDFSKILQELDTYDSQVKSHYEEFVETQKIWAKIMNYFKKIR